MCLPPEISSAEVFRVISPSPINLVIHQAGPFRDGMLRCESYYFKKILLSLCLKGEIFSFSSVSGRKLKCILYSCLINGNY